MDKKYITIVVLSAVALVFSVSAYFSIPTPDGQKTIVEKTVERILGGESSTNTQCIGELDGRKVCYGAVTGEIGTNASGDLTTSGVVTKGSSTASVLNDWTNSGGTGRDVIVDNVDMYFTAKASSTMQLWAATSTRATTTITDFTNPVIGMSEVTARAAGTIGIGQFIIASTTYATGTQPVITSSFTTQTIGSNLTVAGNPTATTSWIWKYGERIMFGVRAMDNACQAGPHGAANSGGCEHATSTNRGIIRWIVRYHYAQ